MSVICSAKARRWTREIASRGVGKFFDGLMPVVPLYNAVEDVTRDATAERSFKGRE